MATEVVKTVKSSGGDYTSLSAWEAGEQRILTVMQRAECSNFAGTPFTAGETLNFSPSGAVGVLRGTDNSSYIRYQLSSGTPTTADSISGVTSSASADVDSFAYQDGEIAIAECYSFQDTSDTVVDGWTVDATRNIKIYAAVGERHSGVWDATKYRIVPTSNRGIASKESYTEISWLQIDTTATTPSGGQSIWVQAEVEGVKVHHNIAINGKILVDSISSGANVYIWNNIAYDSSGRSFHINHASAVVYLYNNTSHASTSVGIYAQAGSTLAINNLVKGASTSNFLGAGFHANSNYNASSDGTSTGGAQDRTSQTFTFVNEAGDNFHLASTDAGAKDFGLSDPGSGLFSDDIDGQTRTGSWDIGADEYVAPATGNPWYYFANEAGAFL